MTELIEDEYEKFPNDAEFQAEYSARKQDLESRKNAIFEFLDNEAEYFKVVVDFFGDAALISDLKAKSNFTIEHVATLQEYPGINAEVLENYYKFGKFRYECGMYVEAEIILSHYLSIVQPHTASYVSALWGRLACRILLGAWPDSLADMSAVKEAIEIRSISPVDQLRQRAWLMHWALFVMLNQRDGFDLLADFFSEKSYLQTMENLCPWLLRYYTVAVVLSPAKRRTNLHSLLSEISSMSYLYSDPITQFLDSLFDQFDFDSAQVKLVECQSLVKNDYFLQIFADRFVREARMLICEMYCTINRKVDLRMLSEKLQLTDEDAERWMVDMVRGSSGGPTLNAKIDSAGKQVIMAPPSKSVYKQVIESTKELTARTATLGANLELLVKEQAVYIKNK
jgi:translation initiation factor 3 subunit E